LGPALKHLVAVGSAETQRIPIPTERQSEDADRATEQFGGIVGIQIVEPFPGDVEVRFQRPCNVA